ncbi:MAG: hypothetical protein AB7P08_05705 [Burkholderiales bacterium]
MGKPTPREVVRALVAGQLSGMVFGWGVRLAAALALGFGAILLSIGWLLGVKPVVEAWTFSSYTARAEGRIVESWVALELDTRRIGAGGHWRAVAKASPCAVVAYAGDWGADSRRAFCGNRLRFSESYTLHDLDRMAPGIPFAWVRDAAGFAVPEIRLDARARDWLSRAKPDSWLRAGAPPATMLAQLLVETDRPVDIAAASWAAPPPAFPLALDPAQPEGALPEAYVRERRSVGGMGLMGLVFLAVGFGIWFAGTGVLLPALPLAVHLFLAAVPLLALPAWGDAIPRYLRHLNPDVAEVVGDMLGEIDITGRLVAAQPGEALLAGGEVLRWPAGGGAHAATFGRVRFTRPEPPPKDGDEALAKLAAIAAAQAAAMPEAERAALFARLEQDKWSGRPDAGLVFLPAARQAVLDPRAPEAVRRAAGDFLSAWVTQPVQEPWPREEGFQERIRLYRALADVPVTGVPILAQSIAERAAQRR